MSFDITQLRKFLSENKYVAYQILSLFDDKTLRVYELYLRKVNELTDTDINAIYHIKFNKLPLSQDEKEKIEEYQKEKRVAWKLIYNVMSVIVSENYDLLIQYMFSDDDILPFQLAKITNKDFINYISTVHNFELDILKYNKQNLIKFYIQNKLFDPIQNNVRYAIIGGNLDIFKQMLEYYIQARGDNINYNLLFIDATKYNNINIIKYLVEERNKLPDINAMTYIAAMNNLYIYKYLYQKGAPAYDADLYRDEFGDNLPDF